MTDLDARPPVNPRELAVTFCHGCDNRGCIWIIKGNDGGNNYCAECCWTRFGEWGKNKLMGFDDETLRRYSRADCGWVPPSVMQAERDRRVRVAAEKVAAEALAIEQARIAKEQADAAEAARIKASCKNKRCHQGPDGRQKLLTGKQALYCCKNCGLQALRDRRNALNPPRPAHRPRLPKRKARQRDKRKKYRQWKKTLREVADDQLFAKYGGVEAASYAIERSMPLAEARELALALHRRGITPVGYYYLVRGSEIPKPPEPKKKRPYHAPDGLFKKMLEAYPGGNWTPSKWESVKGTAKTAEPPDPVKVRQDTERRQLENAEIIYAQTHGVKPSWAKPAVVQDDSEEDDDEKPKGKKRIDWLRR